MSFVSLVTARRSGSVRYWSQILKNGEGKKEIKILFSLDVLLPDSNFVRAVVCGRRNGAVETSATGHAHGSFSKVLGCSR